MRDCPSSPPHVPSTRSQITSNRVLLIGRRASPYPSSHGQAYALSSAAFFAAFPLNFLSGSGLTGLWDRRMALARATAVSRRSGR